MQINYDKQDDKIIHYLSDNARTPVTVIAKKIRKSPNFVKYRIEKLREQKILGQYMTYINWDALGISEYIVYLEIRVKESTQKEVFEKVMNHPFTNWVSSCFGRYNYRIKLLAKSDKHFLEILDELVESFGHGVKKYTYMRIINPILVKNRILGLPKKIKKENIQQNTTISKTDKKLLYLLYKNPVASLLDLGRALEMSPQAVNKKLKKLESSIIEGYTVKINISYIQHIHCIYAVKLKHYTLLNSRMRSFIENNEVFGRSFETFGNASVEITIMPKSIEDLEKAIDDINTEFSHNLESFDTLLMLKREITIPKGIFEGNFIQAEN
ncbi:Lrp/AsnC family transcriptional regulator [archaeon]|nr:Lrp/AsnC family transcriptional regulator [archaeon]